MFLCMSLWNILMNRGFYILIKRIKIILLTWKALKRRNINDEIGERELRKEKTEKWNLITLAEIGRERFKWV